jgi:hypothetical protein
MKIKLTRKIIEKSLPRIYGISEKKIISIVLTEKENTKTFFI